MVKEKKVFEIMVSDRPIADKNDPMLISSNEFVALMAQATGKSEEKMRKIIKATAEVILEKVRENGYLYLVTDEEYDLLFLKEEYH